MTKLLVAKTGIKNGDLVSVVYSASAELIRYRFEFVGVQPLPPANDVYREARVVVGTVELYRAGHFLVESVDNDSDPPVVVLRKVRS